MPADDNRPTPAEPPTGVVATGVGSWPGADVREALRVIRGELAGSVPECVNGMPYLPELPARGPGADMVGRAAHLLVDLPVDLQPQGWRMVDRPGRDAERAQALWRQDLDELAEVFDGWAGPLKVQVTGPWTLASQLWLPLGDRVLSDPGATRDLVASLSEGVRGHLTEVSRLVPDAQLVLQIDEPMLSAVLLGRVRSDSGYRVLRTPETGEVVSALRDVVGVAGERRTVLHTCAAEPPVDVLVQASPSALSLDIAQLRTAEWDAVAGAFESGTALWAGVGGADIDPLLARWRELGLPDRDLLRVGVTPPCGLAGSTPEGALAATRATVAASRSLADLALA